MGFRGLYFTTDADYELGSEIEFILTLPKEITQAGDVNIRCRGRVVRTEPGNSHRGDRRSNRTLRISPRERLSTPALVSAQSGSTMLLLTLSLH